MLKWAGISTCTLYYRPKEGKPGARASAYTLKTDGEIKENNIVAEQIEIVLRQEFCCYGYRMMRAELNERGFVINHKKVYRLMKEPPAFWQQNPCPWGTQEVCSLSKDYG